MNRVTGDTEQFLLSNVRHSSSSLLHLPLRCYLEEEEEREEEKEEKGKDDSGAT